MDIFDRIASDFKKEARISKGDKKSQNEEAQTKNYAEWLENLKEKNPKGYAEWTKYEGAFDPSTGKMNPDRIKKNEGENKGSGGEDISALGQMGKKKASRATWQSSLYSVDGNPPESGFQILHDNDNDPEVEEILMEVFRTGRPVSGFNMATVSLIKKAGQTRSASFYDDDEIIDDIGLDRIASEFFFQR